MTTLRLNEPVIHALVARLEDDLPAVIDELNAEASDGYELEQPKQILDYVPQLELLTDFPIYAIQDITTRLRDDTGASGTGHHTLGIVCFEANPEQRALAWLLRRHARAVASAAIRDRRIEPDVWGVILDRVEWGPSLSSEENPRTYLSWAAIVLELRTDE